VKAVAEVARIAATPKAAAIAQPRTPVQIPIDVATPAERP
jgi:hypothetical protein